MATGKKYPKSFYDDGLGDILDWIDDEVLIHSERRSNKADPNNDKNRPKKVSKKCKLYGDNAISDVPIKKQKRVKFDSDEEVEEKNLDKKLEDRVRGLINRLAAQTMPFVTSEFEKLYSNNSRSAVNSAIFNCIESSIIQAHAVAKRKLVAELMLLVAYLNFKISSSIGASLVHFLVRQLDHLYCENSHDEDKRTDNIIFCLVNLYIIGLISFDVVYEIAKRICDSENFRGKSVELLMIIIKSIGFQLRKDSPALMRQLIVMAQENCKQLQSSAHVDSRIEFMMEALGAIKNNNTTKVGNYGCDIDKDTLESTLKSLIQRTKLPEHLSDATYDEIVNSANWYLLETRIEGKESANGNVKVVQPKPTSSKTEEKICKALGLNKPVERIIFSALLRVSDFVEASNVIIGFGLNHCSDSMLVCIHVAIHEKKYNPFYFDLINNLCKFNRKYKIATKLTIQDKIRVLSRLKSKQVEIFKQLSLELIKSDGVPITILKAIEWGDISDSTKDYLCYLLNSISKLPDEERRKVMSKVEKNSPFANSMRTFTSCFMDGCCLFH